MKTEIDLPDPPEGWEYTGEYRKPKPYEYYLDKFGVVKLYDDAVGLFLPYFILKKVEEKSEQEIISDHFDNVYDVIVFKTKKKVLSVTVGNCSLPYTDSPAFNGFYRYVYERGMEGYYSSSVPYVDQGIGETTIRPVAALFQKGSL
tara:strand:- start:58028 stop:58465 length:438 start_codon:yes stop_codon:yes gene_type:complete